MKILYLTGYISLHGGAEKVTASKVNYLAEKTANDVFLSTYKQGDVPFVYPISPKVKWIDLGIGYDTNYGSIPLYTFRQFKHVPKHFWRTRKLISKIKPDVIVVLNPDYEFWFLPLIKGKAKIIREFHSSMQAVLHYTSFSKQGLKQRLDDYIQKKYDRVVVLTNDEINYFKYKKNISVIPNPVVETDLLSDQTTASVITVGRIVPIKQFEKYIEVAYSVVKECHDAKFLVYGDGEETYVQSLIKYANKLGVGDQVKFMGKTDDVPQAMSESSIYVCTSAEESFGVTLVEAQESGLPVVSFDCPNGPRNIINNGKDGLLVSYNSVEECSEAVVRLLNDNALRKTMSINARENARHYHLDNIMKKWIELFKSI